MNTVIRDAENKDAEDIQRLYYETWLSTYISPENGIAIENLKKRFDKILSEKSIEWLKNFIDSGIPENHKYLVAENDYNKIVGVMYIEKEPDHNRIQGLYILPNYQGMGIGTSLWNMAKSFIDTRNKTIIDVATYNDKAIEFYKKLGFIETKKRFLEEVSDKDDVRRPMLEMVLNT